MSSNYGDLATARRKANSKALSAFGVDANQNPESALYKEIRSGSGPTIFTVGYERRDGEDLISALIDAGVDTLIDVRERPFSRKPDFRRGPLEAICEEAGIDYQSWTRLGSTQHQRENLKSSGDFSEFRRRFKSFAKRGREEDIVELAKYCNGRSVALICYERCHDECHRSVLAELVAEINDATITAIQ